MQNITVCYEIQPLFAVIAITQSYADLCVNEFPPTQTDGVLKA